MVGAALLSDLRFRRLTPDPLSGSAGTRVWAHYVDTLEDLERKTSGGFLGIEVDIHYVEPDRFLVTHDSPGPEDRLNLEDYFARDDGKRS